MKPFKKSFTKNSEGELKKRLNYHADNNDYFMVDIEKIEEILDEAKKELLTFHAFADAGMMPKHIYSVYITEKIEKWFGTPEKETT